MLKRGFTLIEIVLVVAIVATLVSITVVGFVHLAHRAGNAAALSSANDAAEVLEIAYSKAEGYPPNLAGTDFAANDDVAIALYTNVATELKYVNLDDDQNAQLFLNSCNGHMPIMDGSTTYNTSCKYQAGKQLHIKGKKGSNTIEIKGGSFEEADFVLSCGPACDAAVQAIIDEFIAQGGKFPVYIPKGDVPLPPPVEEATGLASKFCVEARYVKYPNIIVHMNNNQQAPAQGHCDTVGRGLTYP